MAEARESWYQNAEQVTITLFAKNVEAKSVEPTLVDERTLEVAMRLPAAYRRRWRLYGAVVAPCAVAVTAYKVELTLRKAAPLEWPALEAELGGTEEATAADSATILRRPNTHGSLPLTQTSILLSPPPPRCRRLGALLPQLATTEPPHQLAGANQKGGGELRRAFPSAPTSSLLRRRMTPRTAERALTSYSESSTVMLTR